MKSSKSGAILSVALFGLSATGWAEPEVERERPVDEVSDQGVWGDPEEFESTDKGWTWFGMGYEQRMRGLGSSVTDNVDRSGQTQGGPDRAEHK